MLAHGEHEPSRDAVHRERTRGVVVESLPLAHEEQKLAELDLARFIGINRTQHLLHLLVTAHLVD